MPERHKVTRPYPGLRPFESWEGEIFFGREEHTDRLLDILQQQHFLAVIGPSGSGKSSLVRAGLLPALPLGSLGTGSDWRIALLRPGDRPLQRLAQVLLAPSVLGLELAGAERARADEREPARDVALVEAELRRGPRGLIDLVQSAGTRRRAEEPFNLLVLVDQFEELFTYADAGGHHADESEAFVNLLLASKSVRDTGLYIVLTMRTDFLGNCVRYLELPDVINRAQYLTPRLTREQIERAITGPARIFDGDVEPTLVAELINAVSGNPDQLPILQHALARMWESARAADRLQITWKDFEDVGGIKEALSRHADHVLASLSPRKAIEEPLSTEQRAAEILFRAITGQRTAEAGGQAVRRPQSLAEVAAWSGRRWQDFVPPVTAFAGADVNFLNCAGQVGKDAIIDISHEALIRQWGRLRDWIVDEARLAGEYQRWRERTADWKAAELKRKGSGSLLSGADLVRAVEWRDGAAWNTQSFCKPSPAWAGRYSGSSDLAEREFSEVLEFIANSQHVVLRAKRRERRLKWALIALTVLSFSAMTVAIGFAVRADRQLVATEASALWHPLDFRYSVTDKQAEGLLRVAESDERPRRAFLSQLIENEYLAERFNEQPDLVIGAAVGVDPGRRDWFLERLYKVSPEDEPNGVVRVARALALSELDGRLAPRGLLAAIQATTDRTQLGTLGQSLAAVTSKVPEAQADSVADELAAAIQAAMDAYQLKAIGDATAAIAGRLPETQIRPVVEKLVAAIRTTEDSNRLDALGEAVSAVAGKIPERQAETALNDFLSAMLTTESFRPRDALGKGLSSVAQRVPQVQAEAAAERIVSAIRAMADTFGWEALGTALETVAAKALPEHAAGLAAKLLAAVEATEASNQLAALARGITAVADKIDPAQTEALANKVVTMLKATEDSYRLEHLAQSLAGTFSRLGRTQAMAVARQLVLAIQEGLDLYQLGHLGQLLAALPVQLTDQQNESLATRYVDAIQFVDPQRVGSGYYLLTDLAKVVHSLPLTLTEAQSQALVTKLVRTIMGTDTPTDLMVLDEGLAAAVATVPAPKAGAVIEELLAAISTTTYTNRLSALRAGLEAVAGKVSQAQSAVIAARLVAAIPTVEDLDQLDTLGRSLAALPSELTQLQAEAVAERFVAKIEAEDYRYRFSTLDQGLAAVMRNVPKAQAGTVADKFVRAIEATRDPKAFRTIFSGIAALPVKLDQSQAQTVLERFVATVLAEQEWSFLLRDISRQVVSLSELLTDAQATTVAERVLAAIPVAQKSDRLAALGQVLDALARMVPNPAALADRLMAAIQTSNSPQQLVILGGGLAAVAERMPAADRTAHLLFGLMKNPLLPRDALTHAVRHLFPDAPAEEQGLWALIEWADQRFPDLDLALPLPPPQKVVTGPAVTTR